MIFFTNLFKKKNEKRTDRRSKDLMQVLPSEIDTRYVQKGLTRAVSAAEQELVTKIIMQVLPEQQSGLEVAIKRVLAIDEEKQRAVAITAAIAANDAADSQFILHKITALE